MSLGRPLGDVSQTFNSVYKVTLDMSGWDKTTVQVVGPMGGRINLLGSNDGGQTSYASGNASLAINFTPIQATDLSTGTTVNAIYGAGMFAVTVNAQYLRLQGSPASAGTSVYRMNIFDSKGS